MQGDGMDIGMLFFRSGLACIANSWSYECCCNSVGHTTYTDSAVREDTSVLRTVL